VWRRFEAAYDRINLQYEYIQRRIRRNARPSRASKGPALSKEPRRAGHPILVNVESMSQPARVTLQHQVPFDFAQGRLSTPQIIAFAMICSGRDDRVREI